VLLQLAPVYGILPIVTLPGPFCEALDSMAWHR
jgi:hypothetical protein